MNRNDFGVLRDSHYRSIVAINDTKGHDYAGEEDALKNFKEAAAAFGISPIQVWAIYHHKHQSAIDTFVREGQVHSEPIEGRIHDAILYLFLLLGLIEDQRKREGERGMLRGIESTNIPRPDLSNLPEWVCVGGNEDPHAATIVPGMMPCKECGRTTRDDLPVR